MRRNTLNSYLAMSLGVVVLTTSFSAVAASRNATIQKSVEATQTTVQEMQGDVTSLSRTTADIAARMDSTEQQLRMLVTLSEDNQRSIAQLQASINELTRILYQSQGLSVPSGITVVAPTLQGNPATASPSERPVEGTTGNPPVEAPVVHTPTAPPVVELSVDQDQHYRTAQGYYSKREYSAALLQFEEHTTKFPESPHVANATYWRAHCYFMMEDYPQAVQGYEQLRTQYSASEKVPFSIYNEAVAYTRLGETDKAKALLQQLIREYPDDAATDQARKGLRQLQGLTQ